MTQALFTLCYSDGHTFKIVDKLTPHDCIARHTLHAIVNLNSAEETCLISSNFLIMLANTQSTNQHFFTGYTEMSVFQNATGPLKCPFLAVSSLLRLSFI